MFTLVLIYYFLVEQLNSVPECNKVFSKLTKQVHSRNSDILFDELIANPIVKPLTITKLLILVHITVRM